MRGVVCYGDADIAFLRTQISAWSLRSSDKLSPYLAMYVVLPKTFASPADSTIVTVVDTLGSIVIPQFANITEIPRGSLAACLAVLRCSLWCPTQHTQHVLCSFPIELVGRYSGIVTMPA